VCKRAQIAASSRQFIAVPLAFDARIDIEYPQRLFRVSMSHVRAVTALVWRVFAGTLSCSDCRLLFCVSGAEPIALAALRCGSIRAARRSLAWLRPLAVVVSGRPSEERVIWALGARGRWLRSSTCLGRALVAELLIEQIAQPMTVVIGVASVTGGLRSHAWIERNGHVLLGGEDARRQYVPLVAWSATP
jgi:hypothetical protein